MSAASKPTTDKSAMRAVPTNDLGVYDNPFATRHTRPGTIPYLFPGDETCESLVDALQAAGWWGEIVGPHGSGKSTLLETLIPRLEARSRRLVRFALRGGQRRLPVTSADARLWDASTLVIVDGYEQLSWLARRSLQWRCRRSNSGLLVTTHRPAGLTTIFRTEVTPDLAERVVRRLAPQLDGLGGRIDLAELVRRRRGNLRDVLFDLYDLCESRRL
jgi:hypothetical protein